MGSNKKLLKPVIPSQQKGSIFEDIFQEFIDQFIPECGLTLITNLRMKSGTQEGKDLHIVFSDGQDKYTWYFEAKNFDKPIDPNYVLAKLIQIEGQKPDAWVLVSPRIEIGNQIQIKLEEQRKRNLFEILTWTPSEKVKELFSLYPNIFSKIYIEKVSSKLSARRDQILDHWKEIIRINCVAIKRRKGLIKTADNNPISPTNLIFQETSEDIAENEIKQRKWNKAIGSSPNAKSKRLIHPSYIHNVIKWLKEKYPGTDVGLASIEDLGVDINIIDSNTRIPVIVTNIETLSEFKSFIKNIPLSIEYPNKYKYIILSNNNSLEREAKEKFDTQTKQYDLIFLMMEEYGEIYSQDEAEKLRIVAQISAPVKKSKLILSVKPTKKYEESGIVIPNLKNKGIQNTEKNHLSTDFFFVNSSNLPPLYAYEIKHTCKTFQELGEKLAFRTKTKFGGHWVGVESHLVSDRQVNSEALKNLVIELKHDNRYPLNHLHSIKLENGWSPTAYSIATLISKEYISEDLKKQIDLALTSEIFHDKKGRKLKLDANIRPWVIDNSPAISVVIFTTLESVDNLREYMKKSGYSTNDVYQMLVRVNSFSLKGRISSFIGLLGENDNRNRLISLTIRTETKQNLLVAPDDEMVFGVRHKNKIYDYISSMLYPIFDFDDIEKRMIQRTLIIDSNRRLNIVNRIYAIASNFLYKNITSVSHPHLFYKSQEKDFSTTIQVGNMKMLDYDSSDLFNNLKIFGLYKNANKHPMKIIAINFAKGLDTSNALEVARKRLNSLGFEITIIDVVQIIPYSQEEVEKIINQYLEDGIDIILAFLPDRKRESTLEGTIYQNVKIYCLKLGIPSQFVLKSTMNRSFAVSNIILGILGKTGSIPFILAEPIKNIDYIIGINTATSVNPDQPGIINSVAMTRVFTSSGEFVEYQIINRQHKGEISSELALQNLFPPETYSMKRIIIHHEGTFNIEEINYFEQIGNNIGIEFILVEIIVGQLPRIFQYEQGKVNSPYKGTFFKINSDEALLITSKSLDQDFPSAPILVKVTNPDYLDIAVESVLKFTQLNYGSILPGRLPVTIQSGDRIARMVLDNILSKNINGKIPFWL